MILSRASFILGGLTMVVLGQQRPTTTDVQNAAPTPEVSLVDIWFNSTWILPPMTLDNPLPITYNVTFDPTGEQFPLDTSFSLILCQTNAVGGDSLTSNNTWAVLDFRQGYELMTKSSDTQTLLPLFNGTEFNPKVLQSFFFCFGTSVDHTPNNNWCHTYSPFFDMLTGPVPASIPPAAAAPTYTPTTAVQIVQVTPALGNALATVSATTAPASTSTTLGLTTFTSDGLTMFGVYSTVIASPTSAETSASATAISSASQSHSSGGLSTGAKVGIALGALFLAAIFLLVALFFLRRKHSKRTQPEQVMLTRDMHTDSFSRNLMAEKDELNPASGPSPVDSSLPIQRHSALSPYEPLPSAPYSGVAAAAPSTIPRRKPTTATMASAVSRGISNASNGSALSPRSATTTTGTPGHEFEQYHDTPVYGDARHVPQLNTFAGASHSQAPFLGEEGMSAEEAARLEEEERRIDAAIEAAERERERGNR